MEWNKLEGDSFGELIYNAKNIIANWLTHFFSLLWAFIFNLLISMLIIPWLHSLLEGNKIWSGFYFFPVLLFPYSNCQYIMHLNLFVLFLTWGSILSWLYLGGTNMFKGTWLQINHWMMRANLKWC